MTTILLNIIIEQSLHFITFVFQKPHFLLLSTPAKKIGEKKIAKFKELNTSTVSSLKLLTVFIFLSTDASSCN